jgi:hypothetical protein
MRISRSHDAKTNGKARYEVFDVAMHHMLSKVFDAGRELRPGQSNATEIGVHYQQSILYWPISNWLALKH